MPPAGDRGRGLAARSWGSVVKVSVDICLRGNDFATTESIEGVTREPGAWTDEDVRTVLEGMLRAMDRSKRPGEADREIIAAGPELDRQSVRGGWRRDRDRDHARRRGCGAVRHRQGQAREMIGRVLAPAAPPSASIH